MAAGAVLLTRTSSDNNPLPRVEFACNPQSQSLFIKRDRIQIPLKEKTRKRVLCRTHRDTTDGPNSTDDKQFVSFEDWNTYNEKEADNATGLEYDVICDVEIISWRERRIKASIVINANPQRVWQVLTDYEQLSEFIPNLVCSQIIPCPYPGRIWLLQRGMQRMMYWNIEAHVILDLREFQQLGELHFLMVDGDFKRYDGKWHVQAGSRASTTLLQYEVNVVPKIIFPTALVESIIKSDLPKNLCAIARRAEAEDYHKSPCFSDNHTLAWASKVQGLGNVTMGGVDLQQSALGRTCRLDNNCMVDEIHFRRLDDLLENGGVHRQVVASITVKASSKDVWSVLTEYETLPEFVPNLVNSKILSREGERVRLLQEGCKCLLYMVLHARVILDLWEEPEQGISFRQIEGDFDSFEGTWTLHQLGSQHTVLKYAVDTKIWKNCILAESLVEEVIYEDLPSNLCAIRDRVEKVSKNRSSGLLGSSESSILSEFEIVHEKIETMRCEDGDGAGNHADISMQSDTSVDQKMKSVRNQPLVECLSSDYGLMDREIRNFIATHGQEGVMPMRKDLRQLKRHDIETAIRVMGGYRTVAARMKLSLAYKERKPFGYWDDLQNLQNEVIAVQKQLGCDAKVLPSRLSIERLGKYDLARALERWGGAKEAARILGLKTKGSKKQDRHRKEKKMRQSKIALRRQTQNIPARLSHAMVDPGRPSKKKSAKSVVASEMSARTDQTSSENISHQISRKAVCNALTDITDYSEKSNDLFSGSLVKGKKMPYKTGVPQESSKWLTLVSDAEQQDVQEE